MLRVQPDVGVSGDRADPDGDGTPNLLEYALGLDPRQADTRGLPLVGQITVEGQRFLTLSYTEVLAAADVAYLPQVSSDLAHWNSGPDYTATVSATNSPDGFTRTVVVRDLTPLGGTPGPRFLRLGVARP